MAHIAKKVKKLATVQLYNLKVLLNGRGLSNFKKHYKLKGELGRGGFGVVYRGTRICDELPVAIKFIDRDQVHNWGRLEDERLPMEICMLARCINVPGVIKLLDWYSMPEGFLIVMTRPYPCVDLFDFIKSHKKLDEDLTRFLFRQIVLTVRDCAQQQVLHRDLKDENIVIDLVNGETSLVDFGAATLLKKNHYTDFQGTRLYCPPEWFMHSMYLGREAAVWSLGVLLYNMLNGRLPFRDEKEICTSHLLRPLPSYAQVSKSAMDLINQCLRFEPNKRCTLDTILQHSWIRAPCADWCTLIDRTYQNSYNDQQHDVICANHRSKKQAESSYAESGVGSTSSFKPSTSSSFMARYRRGELGGGGMISGLLSRLSQGCQHWDRIRVCQSKTSLMGDSPSPMNIREFVKMIHLQQNNISFGRMSNGHPINHLSVSTPRLTFSYVQNSEDFNWTRSPALRPLIRKKRSTDSGQQSAFFSPAALLSKPFSHESFNGRTGGVLVF
ncbi:CAMK/PIM protein kinase [Loa loa]|uniref:non-specific serine/threonine protein kinase n=1 Tax=Loa loa TaxID=7209 RepID=A0A1I7VKJ0_LOALO|nr:CAMK/PIM protein kinase [Loa loa]EFO28154.1 CAMK/PIM protein kinase [Loa loa]